MDRVWIEPEDRKPLTRKQIAELFLRQQGKCPICSQKLQTKGHVPVEFIDEHMEPLWRKGTNELGNRGLVCRPCAKVKTAKEAGERAKCLAVRDKAIGAVQSKSTMPCGRRSLMKKRMDGTVVWRDSEEPVR